MKSKVLVDGKKYVIQYYIIDESVYLKYDDEQQAYENAYKYFNNENDFIKALEQITFHDALMIGGKKIGLNGSLSSAFTLPNNLEQIKQTIESKELEV